VDEEHDCHLEDFALTCAVEVRARESSLKEMTHGLPDSSEKVGKTERMGCYEKKRLRASDSEVEIW